MAAETADQATHERVCRAAVADNPDLVAQALRTGDYIPLIKAAMKMEPNLANLWVARRVGELARASALSRGGV